MTIISPFLNTFELAAKQTAQTENDFRRDFPKRAKALERRTRTFAHRRLNFMRAIADAVATTESEEIVVAAATAMTNDDRLFLIQLHRWSPPILRAITIIRLAFSATEFFHCTPLRRGEHRSGACL
jgi:hypothetical protein